MKRDEGEKGGVSFLAWFEVVSFVVVRQEKKREKKKEKKEGFLVQNWGGGEKKMSWGTFPP